MTWARLSERWKVTLTQVSKVSKKKSVTLQFARKETRGRSFEQMPMEERLHYAESTAFVEKNSLSFIESSTCLLLKNNFGLSFLRVYGGINAD